MKRAPIAVRGRAAQQDRRFVTALARGLDILRCFSRKDRELGNAEIAERTRLAKPTVSRLTFTLTQLGYLTYSPRPGATRCRWACSRSATHTSERWTCATSPGPTCSSSPTTCTLRFRSARPIPAGSTWCSSRSARARGRCSTSAWRWARACPTAGPPWAGPLAALPAEAREERLAAYRKATPRPQWEQIEAGIHKRSARLRALGFCLSVGEWVKDVWAVGVPMASREGHRILALNCSGPIFDMNRQRIIQDVGTRLVALRDKVMAATGGVF